MPSPLLHHQHPQPFSIAAPELFFIEFEELLKFKQFQSLEPSLFLMIWKRRPIYSSFKTNANQKEGLQSKANYVDHLGLQRVPDSVDTLDSLGRIWIFSFWHQYLAVVCTAYSVVEYFQALQTVIILKDHLLLFFLWQLWLISHCHLPFESSSAELRSAKLIIIFLTRNKCFIKTQFISFKFGLSQFLAIKFLPFYAYWISSLWTEFVLSVIQNFRFKNTKPFDALHEKGFSSIKHKNIWNNHNSHTFLNSYWLKSPVDL